jgi:raffinose/stachyose/melibiose transport system substrate-binding protein
MGILLLLLLACTGHERATDPKSRKNNIYITLGMYTPGIKLAFSEPLSAAREVADRYSRLHPDINIKFVHQVAISGAQEGDWLKTQLIGGIAPDIIHQNAEVSWPDVDKGWYLPLDPYLEQPNPYIPGNKRWMDSFINQPMMNAKRAGDGKLYCISVDVVETAIYYNKTLFDSLGLTPPETWAEFEHLQQRLLEAGVTPMTSQLNLAADWGQDVIFDMLYHDIIANLDVEPSRESQKEYMTHYLTVKELAFLFEKGFFTRQDPRWVETHRLVKKWRRFWNQELKTSDPARLFLTQRVAMVWDGSWMTRRLLLDPYLDFEWGIFYIPAITQKTSPFATGVEASVIGGASLQLHVTNSATHFDHVEEVIDFLMFLTAPDQFESMVNEAMLFIPNIHGVEMLKELKPIRDIFTRRYCAVKWLESFDSRYKSDWKRHLDLFLNDGMTLDQYLAKLESIFQAFFEHKKQHQNWDMSSYETIWKQQAVSLD